MTAKSMLSDVLAVALSQGGDFAEVYQERKKTTGISLEANQVKRVVSGLDVGVGILVISGDNTAYAYTNDTSPRGLERVAGIVARAATVAWPVSPELDLREPKPVDFTIGLRPDQVPVDDKVAVVQRTNRAARAVDGRVKQIIVGYGDLTRWRRSVPPVIKTFFQKV